MFYLAFTRLLASLRAGMYPASEALPQLRTGIFEAAEAGRLLSRAGKGHCAPFSFLSRRKSESPGGSTTQSGAGDTWGPPGRARSTLNLQNVFKVTLIQNF